jgi:single-strand DNA-binding protein
MASYNRVILVGNLTRDPELRYTPSGTAVSDVGVAVNDRYKNASGEWVEEATFVDVTLWARTAEVASEYLSKGSPILIEGRLKLDTWETNDGQKRSKLRVICERMQMLGGRGEGGGGGGGGRMQGGGGRMAPRRPADSDYNQAGPPMDDYSSPGPSSGPSDDIPF